MKQEKSMIELPFGDYHQAKPLPERDLQSVMVAGYQIRLAAKAL